MRKVFATATKLSLTVFLLSTSSAFAQEMDIMDPWQRDRAAHQKKMDENAQRYQDRWPKHVEERYRVDGVGVIDKDGARTEYDEEHAPVDLDKDVDSEEEAAETAKAEEMGSDKE